MGATMEFPKMMYLGGDVRQWMIVDDAAQQKKAAKAGYVTAPSAAASGEAEPAVESDANA
jgi:acyl dehydratase